MDYSDHRMLRWRNPGLHHSEREVKGHWIHRAWVLASFPLLPAQVLVVHGCTCPCPQCSLLNTECAHLGEAWFQTFSHCCSRISGEEGCTFVWLFILLLLSLWEERVSSSTFLHFPSHSRKTKKGTNNWGSLKGALTACSEGRNDFLLTSCSCTGSQGSFFFNAFPVAGFCSKGFCSFICPRGFGSCWPEFD